MSSPTGPSSAATSSHGMIAGAVWAWPDVWDGPWYVFREPRDEHRLAIKSGHYTILTVGDYFDGGGPIEERLAWICGVVNAQLGEAT